ncbi:hypothetical protein HYDPIDRAFT_120280 [Hydnomerulius pinastri MD-312]|uniref:Uncharacterized protein n=1 Tax=Hydnomerulius pinastri MD-312 TaxID=994086 RepID=A0A0C9VK30_9AGAM|nr:hypothetical protein HYDPIDRAFT_120280 [Hydnomerulius pinastri MD-312]
MDEHRQRRSPNHRQWCISNFVSNWFSLFLTPCGLLKALFVFHHTHQVVALALTTSTSRCELFSDAPHRRY